MDDQSKEKIKASVKKPLKLLLIFVIAAYGFLWMASPFVANILAAGVMIFLAAAAIYAMNENLEKAKAMKEQKEEA
jgi:predicted PurR-regulated permease PerM